MGIYYDTRLAEQLLNPDLPTSLDHLRAAYTKIKPYKPSKKEMRDVGAWGKDRMLNYACWDAVTTFQVMVEQEKVLTPAQRTLLDNLLIPVVPVLNEMERKGTLIDVNLLAGLYARNVPALEALEKDIWDKMRISPHSPKQVREYFDLEDSKRATLEYHIQRGHPKAADMETVLLARDLQKENGTYLKGAYDRLEEGPFGQYLHTTYMPDGTGTGRLSSRNPNLQNQPKRIRALFIAEPGKILISADYKQLELWTVAILGPCPVLLRDLMDGVDIHAMIAEEIRPHCIPRLLDKLRVTAKAVVFGTIYGRGARSIAIQFGVPVAMAEKWQEMCFRKYPGLLKYVRDRMADFNASNTVVTPWGRHRVVNMVTQAINMPVQSSASDVTLSSLLILGQQRHDLRITVHDEIVQQADDGTEAEVIKATRKVMCRPIDVLGGTCFPVDFKVGKNWFEMEAA